MKTCHMIKLKLLNMIFNAKVMKTCHMIKLNLLNMIRYEYIYVYT